MLENGGGFIVNCSSSSAYSPELGVTASYCSAKGGVYTLTKPFTNTEEKYQQFVREGETTLNLQI